MPNTKNVYNIIVFLKQLCMYFYILKKKPKFYRSDLVNPIKFANANKQLA